MTISVPIGNKIISPCLKIGNKKRNYKIFIFLFTLVIYACYKITTRGISVVKPVLNRKNCTENLGEENVECSWAPFDKSNWTQLLGIIDFCNMIFLAVGLVLSGHIASRMHVTYFLSIATLLTAITSALFGFGKLLNIHSFYYYLFAQILAGLLQGTGFPPVLVCMENWFGKKRRGFIMGVWFLHATFGNLLGTLLAGAFVEKDWSLSFIVPAIICGIMAIFIFLFLPPYPKDVGCEEEQDNQIKNPQEDEKMIDSVKEMDKQEDEEKVEVTFIMTEETTDSKPVSFLTAFKIPGVLEYSCCNFFAKFVINVFLLWLPNYIHESDGINASLAADLSAMFDVGGIFGAIISGYLSDLIGSSVILCSAMLILTTPTLFAYLYLGSSNIFASVTLLFLMGFFIYGPNCLISATVSADLGTHSSLKGNTQSVALVCGIINGIGQFGAAVGPVLCGLLYPYGWNSVFYMLILANTLASIPLLRKTINDVQRIMRKKRDS